MPPARIVHLITELSTGGAQTALLRLLRGLDQQRYQSLVLCLFNGDGRVAQEIRKLDIPVIDLGMPSKWRADALWRLYRALRQAHPDILHTWLFHANLSGRILGRLAGPIRIVCSERTMGMESWLRMRFNQLSAPLADRIICVSPQVRDFAEKKIHLPPARLVTIPNGLDLAEYSNLPSQSQARQLFGLPQEGILIGSVARLDPIKGVDQLLEAFAFLLKTPALQQSLASEIHLAIAGDGPERQALQAQANQLALGQKIHFLGERRQIPEFLAGLDLFILASRHEGMPNVLLEAMAAGLPVVATAVGGTPDVVITEETGLLVPVDQPKMLADAAARLLTDAALIASFGKAGRARVKAHFSIENTIQATENVYEALLQNQISPARRDSA
jgi:sugar transferase (PEP-CTERM/EpsH1 system associated)